MKPTIGIIGGCGPIATLDIEEKILNATQRLLHPIVDQDYYNLLVWNRTQFPDRNDALIFNSNTPLLVEYISSIKSLISIGIDVLLIACQTAHAYLPELQKCIDILIVDIVQETIKYINNISPSINMVGLLSTEATKKKKLYQEALIPYNVKVVTVPADIQKKLMQAIYIIKSGVKLVEGQNKITNHSYAMIKKEKYSALKQHSYRSVLVKKLFPNPIEIIKEAIHYLVSKGCSHVILGCTELPLILPHINREKLDVNLIDPNTIVAEAVVNTAYKLELKYLNTIITKKMMMRRIETCAG